MSFPPPLPACSGERSRFGGSCTVVAIPQSSLRDWHISSTSPALKRRAIGRRPSGPGFFKLLLVVLCFDLLRRSLHYVITHRALHAVLIRIVVDDGKFAAKIIVGRRCW